MTARLLLFAEIMQRRRKQAVGHDQLDRIIGAIGDFPEAMREFERAPKPAVIELVDRQAPQRPQQIVTVAETLGKLERSRPGRASLARTAEAVHQRPAERSRQLHAEPVRSIGAIVEPVQGQLHAIAAFG